MNEQATFFDLMANPFLWQGVVFMVFAFLAAIGVHSLCGVPRRIIEASA